MSWFCQCAVVLRNSTNLSVKMPSSSRNTRPSQLDKVSNNCRNMKSGELKSGSQCRFTWISTRYADRPVAILFLYRNMLRKSWDSSVSIVSRLWAGRSGVQILATTKLFIFSKCPYPLWGVGDSFPRSKFGADHCPPHGVEVKKEWSSTPPHVFIACMRKTLFTVCISDLEH